MPPETISAPVSTGSRIARAAGTVMFAFILSNLVGLLRGILIYRAFGASGELDAFNAANRVAEVLYNLVAGGALGSAFIPTFTTLLTRNERGTAWKLASAITNLILLVLTGIAVLAFIFAPQIVRHGLYVLDPSQNPVQEALTVHLLRILLPTVVIFGVSGLTMGVLNAHQVFFVPALAPAMYSLGMIAGVLFFPASWGIERLAYGALLGALLHWLVQLPALLRQRGRYHFSLGRGIPQVTEVARLMGPRVFGVAIVQLNFIVNTIIALGLAEGSVSTLSLAFSLMLMPQMALAQSIAIAAMPTFSAQVARGRLDEMRASLVSTLRGVLLLAIPASVGLVLLRRPIIELLYRNDIFDERSVQFAAWALLWYGIGLVGHSVVEIVSRAFYALHDTRTPVTIGVAAMSLNIVFSLLFSRLFAQWGWLPHGGLALANSLATSLEMVALLIFMRRRLAGLEGPHLLKAVAQAGLGGALMGLALAGWLALAASNGWPVLVTALGGVILGVGVYALVLIILRVDELKLVGKLARRVSARFIRSA